MYNVGLCIPSANLPFHPFFVLSVFLYTVVKLVKECIVTEVVDLLSSVRTRQDGAGIDPALKNLINIVVEETVTLESSSAERHTIEQAFSKHCFGVRVWMRYDCESSAHSELKQGVYICVNAQACSRIAGRNESWVKRRASLPV